jgi:UPF0755 protein
MIKRLLGGVLLGVGVFCLAGWIFYHALTTPSFARPYPVRIFIPEQTSLRTTAYLLAEEKFLSSPQLFLLWARVTKADRKIHSGEYLFPTALSPLDLLRMLMRGDTVRYTVTVTEGMTFKQLVSVLVAKGLGAEEQFACLNTDPTFLARWGLPPQGLEGYLYPATYQFSRRASPEDLLGQMIGRFYAAIDPSMYQQIEASGLSVHQVVTLASLIEKETAFSPERNLVSAVFHNRLRQSMPLQCDSSVIYGIPQFDGNLTRQHLTTPSPYNTYVLRGLPRGPIANPSRDSMLAALHPAQSEYLYFVARGDGTHEFSVDLTSHNRAVRHFQKGQS